MANSNKTLEHTIENSFLIWASYDWSNLGEEWIVSKAWKKSLMENVILPFIPRKSMILEIGPGAGEWTKELITIADKIYIVDLVPRCIEICKERFKEFSNIEYYTNDGRSLDFLESNSVNFVFSMDVFIQMAPNDFENYFRQISSKLIPNGVGIINHSKHGQCKKGWRSNINDNLVARYCLKYDLEIIKQLSSWDDERQELWPGHDIDSISIFKKI